MKFCTATIVLLLLGLALSNASPLQENEELSVENEQHMQEVDDDKERIKKAALYSSVINAAAPTIQALGLQHTLQPVQQALQSVNLLQSQSTLLPQAISTYDVVQPAIARNYIQPAATVNYVQPAVAREYVQPAATVSYAQPAIAREYVQPAATVSYTQPAIAREYVQPAATVSYVQPAASVDYVQPEVRVLSSPDTVVQAVSRQEIIQPAIAREYVQPAVSVDYVQPAIAREYVQSAVAMDYVQPEVRVLSAPSQMIKTRDEIIPAAPLTTVYKEDVSPSVAVYSKPELVNSYAIQGQYRYQPQAALRSSNVLLNEPLRWVS